MKDALFLLPRAVPRDAAIEAWFRHQPRLLATLARTWFEYLRARGDDVRECLHDDQPTVCVGEAAFAYVDVFTAHVNVGFFHGADLDDAAGLLEGTGKRGRHVKLKPGSTVNTPALEALIRAAYADMRRKVVGERLHVTRTGPRHTR